MAILKGEIPSSTRENKTTSALVLPGGSRVMNGLSRAVQAATLVAATLTAASCTTTFPPQKKVRDVGVSNSDANTPINDAVAPIGDGAVPPPPDGSVSPEDGTTPRQDGGLPPQDALTSPKDGALLPPDASDGAVVPPRDAFVPSRDGAVPDGALPDGALPDARLPDAALPDIGRPDGAVQDAVLPPMDAAPPHDAGQLPLDATPPPADVIIFPPPHDAEADAETDAADALLDATADGPILDAAIVDAAVLDAASPPLDAAADNCQLGAMPCIDFEALGECQNSTYTVCEGPVGENLLICLPSDPSAEPFLSPTDENCDGFVNVPDTYAGVCDNGRAHSAPNLLTQMTYTPDNGVQAACERDPAIGDRYIGLNTNDGIATRVVTTADPEGNAVIAITHPSNMPNMGAADSQGEPIVPAITTTPGDAYIKEEFTIIGRDPNAQVILTINDPAN
ncbi:hypothetical protein KA012_01710 [Candidatus Woesebacteria bacterium]|nr:hypothetical protein [Candidatus Woesebacteria bacterium]MBP9718199.1 hypothetical protein [Candidatus Gracilibacteria bacterium]